MLKAVILIVFLIVMTTGVVLFQKNRSSSKALDSSTTSFSTPSDLSPTTTPALFPTPTNTSSIKLSKTWYRIALYGDSLIDTMIDAPDNIESILKTKYPQNLFKIYNYGIGAQNIQDGLNRWDLAFSNRGREYPPITKINPDIIIIGSFAYNPFTPKDSETHKTLLTKLVEDAKKTDAKVFMLAEIAPLGEDFGKGPKGVNWPPAESKEHAQQIIEQLKDVFIVAKEENVPVIDVFDISKTPGSDFGRRELVNIDDGIHPSPEGHKLTAETIIATIDLK